MANFNIMDQQEVELVVGNLLVEILLLINIMKKLEKYMTNKDLSHVLIVQELSTQRVS